MKPSLSIPDTRANIKNMADVLVAAAKKLMEAHDILGDVSQSEDTQDGVLANSNGATTSPRGVDTTNGTLSRANVFYDVLNANGSPMERDAILDAIRAKGSEISKVDTVSAYLKKDKRFTKTGRGKWGLSEWNKSG